MRANGSGVSIEAYSMELNSNEGHVISSDIVELWGA